MSNKDENIFIEPWIDTDGWPARSAFSTADAGGRAEDFAQVETPCYVVSESHLEKNLQILEKVQKETGVKILMALKGFSMYSVFPMMKKYLVGSEASSVNEARLGAKKFGGETHVFSPSYTEENIKEYLKYADHLVFNSFSQFNTFKDKCVGKVSCGIRVNPEHCETTTPMYDPCGPNSHFGVVRSKFNGQSLGGVEGLHFHTLCELGSDSLERTLEAFEEKFGEFLPKMKWVNFGGGHHITRKDYDLNLLYKIIKDFKTRYPHLEVYMEPGEAIALNAGVLVGKVVDIFNNNQNMAVLDISATTHMPDVLEMPYLPTILGAKKAEDGDNNAYTLVGPSCLSGDVIGRYSFPEPLKVGQKLIFMNMAIYTMVKNNTFNGVNLPTIALMDKKGKIKIVREFGYRDFKNRLS